MRRDDRYDEAKNPMISKACDKPLTIAEGASRGGGAYLSEIHQTEQLVTMMKRD